MSLYYHILSSCFGLVFRRHSKFSSKSYLKKTASKTVNLLKDDAATVSVVGYTAVEFKDGLDSNKFSIQMVFCNSSIRHTAIRLHSTIWSRVTVPYSHLWPCYLQSPIELNTIRQSNLDNNRKLDFSCYNVVPSQREQTIICFTANLTIIDQLPLSCCSNLNRHLQLLLCQNYSQQVSVVFITCTQYICFLRVLHKHIK